MIFSNFWLLVVLNEGDLRSIIWYFYYIIDIVDKTGIIDDNMLGNRVYIFIVFEVQIQISKDKVIILPFFIQLKTAKI
jgi:hypothetical protein